jgi:hypothetical protein
MHDSMIDESWMFFKGLHTFRMVHTSASIWTFQLLQLASMMPTLVRVGLGGHMKSAISNRKLHLRADACVSTPVGSQNSTINRLYTSKWLMLLVFCFAMGLPSAHAQAISGDLTGKIFDSSGAAIPTATVVAVNDETGVKTTTQVTAEGVYRFSNLPVGRYTVTASASGFQNEQLKNVELAWAQRWR